MCVSVLSLQHMRALCLWGPEESIGFPGIEVTVMEVLWKGSHALTSEHFFILSACLLAYITQDPPAQDGHCQRQLVIKNMPPRYTTGQFDGGSFSVEITLPE